MRFLISTLCLILCIETNLSAQSYEDADTRLAAYFDKMDYWWQYCYKDRTDKKVDSLRNSGGRIYDYVENIILKSPTALTTELPLAKEKGLHYVTADNGLFRIYSWQAKMEGHETPRLEFRDIAGYTTPSGRKYRDISNGSEGGFCTNITTIRTLDSNTVYVANYYSIENGEKLETLKAYSVIDNYLKEISVFQNGEKIPKQLWCQYTVPLNNAMESLPAIHFNEEKTKLYVPIVETQGESQVLTGKFMVYIFNGYLFVYVKDAQ